jgi:hypothetical protein
MAAIVCRYRHASSQRNQLNALRDQRCRPLRHALTVATLLAAACPIIWIVPLGGPTL